MIQMIALGQNSWKCTVILYHLFKYSFDFFLISVYIITKLYKINNIKNAIFFSKN